MGDDILPEYEKKSAATVAKKRKSKFMRKFYDYFPAMRHKNFRLFWTGQLISVIGTWMQNAALSWVVYAITKDEFKVGLMSAVQFIPVFLFSLHAGLVVEVFPKRKLIILTQFLQLITASLLFILLFIGKLKYGYILIIMFIVGLVQSLDTPSRQAFVVEMVEGRDDLLNAIALNSAAFNGARLIGPAVSGIVMTFFGPKWCFFLNAVSFIAVIAGLFMMNIDDKAARKVENDSAGNRFLKSFSDIGEGLKFIYNNPKLLFTIIVVAIVPTFCINFNIMLPIYTVKTLGLKESAYGFLLSCVGLGAMVSAILVATKGTRKMQFYFQVIGCAGLGTFLILMSITYNIVLACIVLVFCGFSMIMFTTTSNSILQLNSPDYMRGRVMSVYSLVFGGLVPVGSIYTGTTAKYLGIQTTFLISGIIGFVGLFILLFRRNELK